MNTIKHIGLLITSFVSVVIAGQIIIHSTPVQAADTKNFDRSNIISDAVFTNSNDMSVNQIQQFLESKNAVCLVNFQTQSLYDANNDGLGDEPYGKGVGEKVSAAKVIWQASQIYDINPKVILTTLQKEQGFITRQDCPSWRYNTALGYNCPDTAPCSTSAYGFTRQIDYGVWHFRGYFDDTLQYVPYSPGNYYIGYNPNANCGGSTVNIQNRATASLYSYTPYQPNTATLAAAPGQVVDCGAYGNLNFWRYFTDWFGSTQAVNITYSGIKFTTQPFTGSSVSATFTVKNTSKTKITLGRLKVEARSPTGNQYDFPSVNNISVEPGKTYTYRESRVIPEEGLFSVKVSRYHNSSWITPPFSDFSYIGNTQINTKFTKKPTVVTSLSLNKPSIHRNESIIATFKVKNNSTTQTVDIGRTKVEGRHSSGTQYDFPSTPDNLTLQPGEVYEYKTSRSLPETGNYTFKLMNVRQDFGWSTNFPESETNSITRKVSVNVKQPVTVTTSLKTSTTSQRVGDPITATFSMTNHSTKPVDIGRMKVEGRHQNGKQYDFSSTDNNTIIQPGETYNYTSTRSLPEAGSYKFFLINYRNSAGWSTNFPDSENSSIVRNVSVEVKQAVTVTISLEMSTTSPRVGEPVTATFTMHNFSSQPVDIGRMKVEGRHSDGTQHDFGSTVDNTIIKPGETYSYSESRSLAKTGGYVFKLMNYREKERWSERFPMNESADIRRSIQVTVR